MKRTEPHCIWKVGEKKKTGTATLPETEIEKPLGWKADVIAPTAFLTPYGSAPHC